MRCWILHSYLFHNRVILHLMYFYFRGKLRFFFLHSELRKISSSIDSVKISHNGLGEIDNLHIRAEKITNYLKRQWKNIAKFVKVSWKQIANFVEILRKIIDLVKKLSEKMENVSILSRNIIANMYSQEKKKKEQRIVGKSPQKSRGWGGG